VWGKFKLGKLKMLEKIKLFNPILWVSKEIDYRGDQYYVGPNQSIEIPKKISDYSWSTIDVNIFLVVLGFVIIIAVIFLLLLLKYRRKIGNRKEKN
jgi:heme/copper-type cytochrome/quinol oxidase subunit 2